MAAPAPSSTSILGADVAALPRVLGTATDALLAGRATRLVVHLGDAAVDPRVLGALARWSKRNDVLLRPAPAPSLTSCRGSGTRCSGVSRSSSTHRWWRAASSGPARPRSPGSPARTPPAPSTSAQRFRFIAVVAAAPRRPARTPRCAAPASGPCPGRCVGSCRERLGWVVAWEPRGDDATRGRAGRRTVFFLWLARPRVAWRAGPAARCAR